MNRLVQKTLEFSIAPFEWQAKYSLEDGSAGALKKGALFVVSRMETLPLVLFSAAKTVYLVANAALQTLRVTFQAIAILILKATFHEISKGRKEGVVGDLNDLFHSTFKAVGFAVTTPLLVPLSIVVPSICPYLMESMGLYKAPTLRLLDQFEYLLFRAETLYLRSEAPALLRELESLESRILSLEEGRLLQRGSYAYVRGLLAPPPCCSNPPKPRERQHIPVVEDRESAPAVEESKPLNASPSQFKKLKKMILKVQGELEGKIEQIFQELEGIQSRISHLEKGRFQLKDCCLGICSGPLSHLLKDVENGFSFQVELLRETSREIEEQLEGGIERKSMSSEPLEEIVAKLKSMCLSNRDLLTALSEVMEYKGGIPPEFESRLDLSALYKLDTAIEKRFAEERIQEDEPVYLLKERLRDLLRKMILQVDSVRPIEELDQIERTLQTAEEQLLKDLGYFSSKKLKLLSDADRARYNLALDSVSSAKHCLEGKDILRKLSPTTTLLDCQLQELRRHFNCLEKERPAALREGASSLEGHSMEAVAS